MKLNIGSGTHPLPDFLNLDADHLVRPDLVATVPPLPFPDASATEMYLGHVLEHFRPADGQALLRDCYRVLEPGGRLGVVVPDTAAICARWLDGDTALQMGADGRTYCTDDLDDICAYWLFSTVQPSVHLWAYDARTLQRAIIAAGFEVTAPIDRYADPRLSDPSWWQLGYDAVRP